MYNMQNKKICSISGLSITTNPEWEFETDDGHYSLHFSLIGDDILFHRGIGVFTVQGMEKYMSIVESIIETYFKDGKLFYQISDLSLAKGFDFDTRKPYVQWGEKIAKQMHSSLYYNVSFSMKTIIKIGKTFSSNFNMMEIVDSYEDAMQKVLDHKSQLNNGTGIPIDKSSKDKSLYRNQEIIKTFGKKETDRINELIMYMGKMSWWDELDQKLPALPKDDPFYGLYSVVESIQNDLRLINKQKDLEKELLEKDKLILEQKQKLVEEQVKSEKLKSLRFQLKPHFLYNILNSLHYLIENSPQKARDMTLHLAKYFQHILSEETDETIPLKNEISLIEEYISLQKIRFENQLESSITCPQHLIDLKIPGLIIFPLIENAVKYGYSTHEGLCRVNLLVSEENEKLVIVVDNDGRWIAKDDVKKSTEFSQYEGGIGMDNIRRRLKHHFKDDWSLSHKQDDEKVFVTLLIPKK